MNQTFVAAPHLSLIDRLEHSTANSSGALRAPQGDRIHKAVARLRPNLGRELEQVVISTDYLHSGSLEARAYLAVGGFRGFLRLERQSRAIVRLFCGADSRYRDVVSDANLRTIQTCAFSIRLELPLILTESILSYLFPVTKTHALRAAQLYSDIVGTIESTAEARGSAELAWLGSRL